MNGNMQENVTRSSIWLRLVFMIVLGVAFYVAEFVTYIVAVFQFLTSLFTGKPNDRLTRLGRNLARYLQQIMVFMTFASEEKPFPFAPWPDELHQEPAAAASSGPMNEMPETATNPPREDVAAKAEKKTSRKASAPKRKASASRKTAPRKKPAS